MRYFESVLEYHVPRIRVIEIVELCEAFTENKNLGKDYFNKKLDTIWKNAILSRWKREVIFSRKNTFRLCQVFEKLNYWNNELWDKLIERIHGLKDVRNRDFTIAYYEQFNRMNTDKGNPYFGKLNEQINKIKNKLITTHQDWDYNVEEMRPWTYDEWLDRKSVV